MDGVLEIINRANQRGGRMLSIIDLIEAETLALEAVAWMAVKILDGSSFLVGAKPGGAGKTTVMGALLGLLPAGETVRLARDGTGWETASRGECVVAYEIGSGFHEAYIWGRSLVDFCRLGRNGVRLVSNLHADTIAQAESQIVRQNKVEYADFLTFDLFLPVEMSGRWPQIRRKVPALFEASAEPGNEIGSWGRVNLESQEYERIEPVKHFLTSLSQENVRTIEDVRHRWVRWLEGNSLG